MYTNIYIYIYIYIIIIIIQYSCIVFRSCGRPSFVICHGTAFARAPTQCAKHWSIRSPETGKLKWVSLFTFMFRISCLTICLNPRLWTACYELQLCRNATRTLFEYLWLSTLGRLALMIPPPRIIRQGGYNKQT